MNNEGANRIRSFRERWQFNQAEMSKLLGLGRSHYCMIEQGDRSLPDDKGLRVSVYEEVLAADESIKSVHEFLDEQQAEVQEYRAEIEKDLIDRATKAQRQLDAFKEKRDRLKSKWKTIGQLLYSGKCNKLETSWLLMHELWCKQQLERWSAKKQLKLEVQAESLQTQLAVLQQ